MFLFKSIPYLKKSLLASSIEKVNISISIVKAQEQIDIEYQNKEEWVEKCVDNICHMGFFSSDRSIKNYADNIWKIQLHILLFLVKWFDHLQNNIQ